MTFSTMPVAEELDACFRAIESRCAERGLTVARLAYAQEGCIGVQLEGTSHTWQLYVDCHETLLRLPRLWLAAPQGLLAHVSYGGEICVNDGQGISLDPDRHADIVAYTVLAGYDLLEDSAADAASGMVEFFNELEGYWLGLPGSRLGRAAFEVDGVGRLLTAYLETEQRPPKWNFTERNQPLPKEFHAKRLATKRALYLHLENFPVPPAPPERLTADFINAIYSALSGEQQKLWTELFAPSKSGPKQVALLMSVPRAAGGRSLVGAVFAANRGVVDSKTDVIPLTVRRHTPKYMRERGGASLELMERHVAVLGCGAVGAVVADALAAVGVGKLTLVDHDNYSEDNVFRHVLAPMWIDAPKVIGLRYELERKYPGVRVTAVPQAAQTWLRAAELADLDGVVLAFGAPSVERIFSRYFQSKAKPLPIVFTWLEALDLGGHSILTWSNREGCLDCLYRDDEGHPALHPRTSFLEPGQHVTRNLTGCGSVFVPFGALQARKTGLLAAEHLLSALKGVESASYRFWLGEGAEAAAAGLRTTNWWKTAAQTTQPEATLRAFGRPCRRCRSST
ncbi:ThiF family adenylyltransferase [Ralstonia wenshanensis]|uniref:ThiF family adenylyltransferase n=1 Tax=Ralstonia wenshanensis TaxID=2842456 RepID=UPI001E344AF0|nr:ThiF family adenylyltransferase [Ralstonia wenshanensis]UGS90965.1 ThiF family adenylyltransferase [Ralstonia wenshanensis]